MNMKQVAERIQSFANVRDIQDLTFTVIKNSDKNYSHKLYDKKSPAINVLTDEKRNIRIKDLRQQAIASNEKDNIWEFFDLDDPGNFYSIEFTVKK
jgi:hypothetical protein